MNKTGLYENAFAILAKARAKYGDGDKFDLARLEQEITEIIESAGLIPSCLSFEDDFIAVADQKVLKARRVRNEALMERNERFRSNREKNAEKQWKSSVILQLASLFARHAPPKDYARYQEAALPHSRTSHFVQFVVNVLKPHVHLSEANANAISVLWANQKKTMRTNMHEALIEKRHNNPRKPRKS